MLVRPVVVNHDQCSCAAAYASYCAEPSLPLLLVSSLRLSVSHRASQRQIPQQQPANTNPGSVHQGEKEGRQGKMLCVCVESCNCHSHVVKNHVKHTLNKHWRTHVSARGTKVQPSVLAVLAVFAGTRVRPCPVQAVQAPLPLCHCVCLLSIRAKPGQASDAAAASTGWCRSPPTAHGSIARSAQ